MTTPPIVAQDGPMDRTSYLASLQADSARLPTSAGGALDRDVPTCPGWTCERLIGHIGRVHRWTARWVSTGGAQDVERPPAGEAVVAWARSGLDELVAAITVADDVPTPVDTALAIDAIDELFAVVLPMRGTGGLDGDGRTIHLHATDPDLGEHDGGEWLVTLAARGPQVTHAHAKGDVAVRGTPSDLLLLLWNRLDPDRCEVFGDTGLLARWRDSVTV